MELSELVYECKKGKIAAQKCLLDHFSTTMFWFCNSYLRNPEEAQEAMMDGFKVIFNSINKFNYTSDAALRAWIKEIMANKCMNMEKLSRRRPVITMEPPEDIIADDNLMDRLDAEDIVKLLNKLPQGCREVFEFYAIDGYTHKQIAIKLGISEGTSKSQVSRARGLIRELLDKNNISYEKAADRKYPGI